MQPTISPRRPSSTSTLSSSSSSVSLVSDCCCDEIDSGLDSLSLGHRKRYARMTPDNLQRPAASLARERQEFAFFCGFASKARPFRPSPHS